MQPVPQASAIERGIHYMVSLPSPSRVIIRRGAIHDHDDGFYSRGFKPELAA